MTGTGDLRSDEALEDEGSPMPNVGDEIMLAAK